MKYLELAIDSVRNRNILTPVDDLPKFIEKARLEKKELYASVWTYGQEIVDHFNSYKTVRSFRGPVGIREIAFDIDKGDSTDAFVLQRAREFVKKLEDDWSITRDELQYYYSGRGYHIIMPNYFNFQFTETTRQEVKSTIQEYFPEADLAIYGATGLLRSPYSLNQKTGRFKIPLTYHELMTYPAIDIISLSESNQIRTIDYEPEERNFSQFIIKANVERQSIRYRDEPTKVVTCMQHLYNKGPEAGSRHVEILRLASTWRRSGLPIEAVIKGVQDWAKTIEPYEVERIVRDVYDKGYRFGCGDHIMLKYCDPKCIYFQHKNFNAGAENYEMVENMLTQRYAERSKKPYLDYKDLLNLNTSYRVYEGEMVVYWGDTKLGKSALVQNIVVNSPHLRWLYLPLENGTFLDSRRMIQIAHNMTKDGVEQAIERGVHGLMEPLKHVLWADKSINVDDLRKLIGDSGCNQVVIDTADQLSVNGKYDGYTDETDKLARALREITRTTSVTIHVIHHISKRSSEDENGKRRPLTIHSGKGSSALEQKADKVIGLEGERDGSIRIVKSLGARDEAPFSTMLEFDKEYMKFRHIKS